MGKVIIAIHGLGNKPPKEQLEKWGKLAVEEGFKNCGIRTELPKFELVYWADILYDRPQTREEKDHKSPYYLDEVYTKKPKNFMAKKHPYRKKMLKALKNLIYSIFLNKDYELRYGFVSQKMLHSYFHEMEIYLSEEYENSQTNEVSLNEKQQIIKRLADVLNKYQNDDILLVAHSMGTIIAFDVLSFVAKNRNIHTLVTMGSPLGMPFVISKIASHSKKENQGHLKLQTPESVLKHWYNLSDVNDNIAIDYKLADDFKSNSKGVKVIDKFVTNTYVMEGIINPHKSYGYLRTPEFIRIITEFINEK